MHEYTLVYDTSANACNVGVFKNEHLISHEILECKYGHAEHIIDLIKKVMTSTHLTFEQLTQIFSTKGPGSFTGIRAGLSVAKMLELSLNIPVIGIDSFTIAKTYYKRHRQDNCDFLIVLDTRKDDFYTQLNGINDAKSMKIDEIKAQFSDDTLITGDGALKFEPLGYPVLPQPPFFNINDIYQAGLETENKNLSPFYLAPPKISKRKASKNTLWSV